MIEVIVIVHVCFNTIQIDIYIFKLFHKKKARGHALSSWNSITLMRGGSYEIKYTI
jgi:hypothetical protein